MIRKIHNNELESVYQYVTQDYARNYFIILGLMQGNVFKAIYIEEVKGDIQAVLFYRNSKNLQFCAYGPYDSLAFIDLIKSLDFNRLISPKSFCLKLASALVVEKKGAIISKLLKADFVHKKDTTTALHMEDLDAVVRLYKTVFTGFPDQAFMAKKLLSKRGRGVCIKMDHKIVALAQSEFEHKEGGLIVGVATDPDHQKKGYGSRCVRALAGKLLEDMPAVYLQYDNPDAGKIYERLGFKKMDQVYHYKKG